MYILRGVHGDGKIGVIWDTDDGTIDEVDLVTVAREVCVKGTRIYGMQKFSADMEYPPDARIRSALGVVIIPSESAAAIDQFTSGKGVH